MHLWDLVDLFDSQHLTRYIDGLDVVRLFECGSTALNARLRNENLSLVFCRWDPRFWNATKFMILLTRRFLRAAYIQFDLLQPTELVRLETLYLPTADKNIDPTEISFPNLKQLKLDENNGSLISCSMGRFFLLLGESVHTAFPVLNTLEVRLRNGVVSPARQLELGAFFEFTPRTVHDLFLWMPKSWDILPLDVMREEQPKLETSRLGICLNKLYRWNVLESLYGTSNLVRLELQFAIDTELRCSQLPKKLQYINISGNDGQDFVTMVGKCASVYFDDPPPELVSFVAKSVKKVVILAPLPPSMQIFKSDSLTIDDAPFISILLLPKTLLQLELIFEESSDREGSRELHHLVKSLKEMDPSHALETLKCWPPNLRLDIDPKFMLHYFNQFIYSAVATHIDNLSSAEQDVYDEKQIFLYYNYRYLSLMNTAEKSDTRSIMLKDLLATISRDMRNTTTFVAKYPTLSIDLQNSNQLTLYEFQPDLQVTSVDARVYAHLTSTIVNHLFPRVNSITSCQKLQTPVPKQFVAITTHDLLKAQFEDPTTVSSLWFVVGDQLAEQTARQALISMTNLKHVTVFFPLLVCFIDALQNNAFPKSVETMVLRHSGTTQTAYGLPKKALTFDASILPPNLAYLDLSGFALDDAEVFSIVKSIRGVPWLDRLVVAFTNRTSYRIYRMHVHCVDFAEHARLGQLIHSVECKM